VPAIARKMPAWTCSRCSELLLRCGKIPLLDEIRREATITMAALMMNATTLPAAATM
jgi:hypothetical protein